jgi:hypothetical protein
MISIENITTKEGGVAELVRGLNPGAAGESLGSNCEHQYLYASL